MSNKFGAIDNEYGASQGTLRSYIVGFLLSILLTLIPYFLVVNHALTSATLILVIILFGVMQLIVQLVFFLHVNPKSKARWNLIALVFTILMVLFLAIGSVWIMNNLDKMTSQNAGDKEEFMLKQNEGHIPK